jgi:IS5 family transposase
MKTTFLVDTETLTILDVHATVTRKHYTKILPPLLRRAMKRFLVEVLCADKGYDDQKIRDWLRSEGVMPLIKHWEFKPVDKAHNARMKKQDLCQRAMSETANSTIKRKYADTLTAKNYQNQKKEILLIATINNIGRRIETICLTYIRISTDLEICIYNGLFLCSLDVFFDLLGIIGPYVGCVDCQVLY